MRSTSAAGVVLASARVLIAALVPSAALTPISAGASSSAAAPEIPAVEYQDRVIEGLSREVTGDGRQIDPDGVPRSLRIELRRQSTDFGSGGSQGRQSSWAANLKGAAQTVNWGALSLDATYAESRATVPAGRNGTGGLEGQFPIRTSSASLYQLGVPMGSSWEMSNALGVIPSMSGALMRDQPSIMLPNRLVEGVATQWTNAAKGISLSASSGRAGIPDPFGTGGVSRSGLRATVVGFEVDPGSAAAMGPAARASQVGRTPISGSMGVSGLMGYGAWLSRTTSSPRVDSSGPDTDPSGRSGGLYGLGLYDDFEATSIYQVLKAGRGTAAGKLNLIATRADSAPPSSAVSSVASSAAQAAGSKGTRLGGWLDVEAGSTRSLHRISLHAIESGVAWSGLVMPGNTMGGSYRWNAVQGRHAYDIGVGHARPLNDRQDSSGLRSDSVTHAYGTIRVQAGAGLSYGASMNVRATAVRDGPSDLYAQVTGYADSPFKWASVRTEVSLSHDSEARGVVELSSDQSWVEMEDLRVRTFGGALWSQSGESRVNLGAGAAYHLNSRSYVDFSGRVRIPVGSSRSDADAAGGPSSPGVGRSTQLDLTSSAQVELGRGLTAIGSLSIVAARSSREPGGASAWPGTLGGGAADAIVGTNQGAYGRSTERSTAYWLGVRYDFDAGSPAMPLGGSARSGAGSVSGVVFLDSNENGRLDGQEQGVADAFVLLDGRFVTRTDPRGRFVFPLVSPGARSLTVQSDSIPLPWTFGLSGGLVELDVRARSSQFVEIGATRSAAALPGAAGE